MYTEIGSLHLNADTLRTRKRGGLMIWKLARSARLSHSLGLEIVSILTSSLCSQPFYILYITPFHHPPDDDTCIGVELLGVKISLLRLLLG